MSVHGGVAGLFIAGKRAHARPHFEVDRRARRIIRGGRGEYRQQQDTRKRGFTAL